MQFLAYILIYPFLWIISILPFKVLYFISDILYVLVYYVIGYRKKTVMYNLRLVFPDKTEKERISISKKFFHHLCDMILESIKSLTISEKEMKKHFTFTNVELIQELEKTDKNIALMCAHYANFEWIFILQTYVNRKGYAVYKRLTNKYFDALVKRIRARYNSYLITTKETIPTLLESKKTGELSISGFVSDQSPKAQKAFHWNAFMGIKVPVHTGAEMLAKRLDMSVVFFGVKKIKRGYYETSFKTLALNANDYKDYEITDMFLKLVEKQILEAPEYYLWTHKRWKHKDKVPAKFK
ncbi:lysophospholipid acyltransferase family protein [Lacinutrix sp. C3R15]|uniref:lysophospholipid acyltransferase family protein n=1 Tax=Flavobacteriaceae TaxID=49546 RepID=UPI001C09A95F|nr:MULTISPECIES: lysophospholipid acyltransferase family protein [Flavobacteriaceae]MBU2940468.1 lysophospholipid acyltransferase family protein [Lacinutrix sp. C3R15]MDO6623788.1 lysophospholipid acyltransferase family protein [Oceanihabitans sp. 1_MG-2023]